MSDEVAVVLQARMGSKRLPGKVLADLAGRSILAHCITRLQMSGLAVIVATTRRRADDAVQAEARRCGAEVFRGEDEDVLARYLGAAAHFGLEVMVRATADNPAVDLGGASRVVQLQARVGADHVIEGGLPVGGAVEAVTTDALRRARLLISDPYDLEHVTSFIRRDRRFQALRSVAPAMLRRPGLRLTVDTEEDLAFMRAVFAAVGERETPVPLAALTVAAESILLRTIRPGSVGRGA